MILLLIIFFIEFLLALYLCGGDYFRPGILFSTVMLSSGISATYLSFIWKFDLNPLVILIYASSVLIVIALDYFISRIINANHTPTDITEIKTNIYFDVFVIVLGILTIFYHIAYLRSTFGDGSWLVLATQYRQSVVWESLETTMSSTLGRLINFTMIFAYIYTYLVVNNILCKTNKKRIIVRSLPIVLYCIDSMLMGARGYIIYLAIAGVTYFYILLQRKSGWKSKQGFKTIKKIAYVFMALAILFVVAGSFIGKSSEGSIFYKISIYLGGGIALFNDYISTGGMDSPAFGAITFFNLYKYLMRFGFPDYTKYFQFEFRYDWGNVYTAVRRYHQDFGFLGVIVCVSIFAVVLSWLYHSIKKDNSNKLVDLRLIIYGMLVRSIFLFFIDDELFADFFTPTTIKTVLEFFVLIYLMTGLKLTRAKVKLRKSFR